MRSKLLIGGLLASVMLVPAFAQSSPPSGPLTNPPAAQSSPPAVTPAPGPSASTASMPVTQSGQWRASKLIGVNVYNEQNEKLGDISEILLDKSGKVDGVIIGVGGFLGMGQRDIKVELSKLKFVDEPMRSSATTTSNTTGAGTVGSAVNRATTAASNATTSVTGTSGKHWYPDHAILSGATKEQLKNLPEFKY